ncbi:MAG: GNAT family N-acetyltransferase [Verrucomicrobiota bacterium]
MSYQILRNLEEVKSLEMDWKALISEEAAPFASYGWNIEWLRSFRSVCDEILVFAFYEDEALVAIFPLYRKDRQMRFIGDGCSHHQDIIARDAASAKWGWRVVMGYVRSEGCNLIMPKVAADSMISEVIALSMNDTPLLLKQQSIGYSPCYRVAPVVNGASLVSRVGPEGVEVRVCEGRQIMDGEIEKAADLHSAQYRGNGELSLFENDVFRQFVRCVARREDAGSHLLTLSIGGDLAAFVLGFARGGTFYVYASGIDGRYRDQAPDRYLWAELVRKLQARGEVSLIDISCSPEATGPTRVDAEYELFSIMLRQKTAMNRLFSRTVGFLPPSARSDGLAADRAELYETVKR